LSVRRNACWFRRQALHVGEGDDSNKAKGRASTDVQVLTSKFVFTRCSEQGNPIWTSRTSNSDGLCGFAAATVQVRTGETCGAGGTVQHCDTQLRRHEHPREASCSLAGRPRPDIALDKAHQMSRFAASVIHSTAFGSITSRARNCQKLADRYAFLLWRSAGTYALA
jgi:hypothetical protein